MCLEKEQMWDRNPDPGIQVNQTTVHACSVDEILNLLQVLLGRDIYLYNPINTLNSQ